MRTFRITTYAVLVTMLTIFCTLPALAWDETGHKITAYIAWQRMTPEVRERVIKLLRRAPEDSHIAAYYMPYGSQSLEARRREFFMVMSVWPDMIKDRDLDVRNKKYNHSNWHYQDTFWQWKDGKAEIVEGPEEGGHALEKLKEFDELIKGSASEPEKAVAIAWIIHLIGDLHQPLHTSAKVSGSSKKGDQGGNLFFLTPKGTPRDKQQNLHSFWDGIIGRAIPNTDDLCDSAYLRPIAEDIMKQHPFDKNKDKLRLDALDAWQKESLDIAMTEAYRDVKFFELPSDKYRKKVLKIAEQQLALAGYRMAEVFNRAFTPIAVTPAPVAPSK